MRKTIATRYKSFHLMATLLCCSCTQFRVMFYILPSRRWLLLFCITCIGFLPMTLKHQVLVTEYLQLAQLMQITIFEYSPGCTGLRGLLFQPCHICASCIALKFRRYFLQMVECCKLLLLQVPLNIVSERWVNKFMEPRFDFISNRSYGKFGEGLFYRQVAVSLFV